MIITCPQCNSGMDAPALAAGKAVRCPVCGHVFEPALPRAEFVDLSGDDDADADILPPDAPAPATGAAAPSPPPAGEPAIREYPVSQYVSQAPGSTLPAGARGVGVPNWSEAWYQAPKRTRDANALAHLADLHENPPPPDPPPWRGDPTMPKGWFIETSSGDVGPFSSREISAAANLGLVGIDATIKNHHKNVRLQAGNVPELFPEAIPVPDPNADGWFIDMPGQDLGPFTSNQIADAASRGQISPEIILKYPRKGLRLAAGEVPSLFKGVRTGQAAQPANSKDDTAPPDLAL